MKVLVCCAVLFFVGVANASPVNKIKDTDEELVLRNLINLLERQGAAGDVSGNENKDQPAEDVKIPAESDNNENTPPLPQSGNDDDDLLPPPSGNDKDGPPPPPSGKGKDGPPPPSSKDEDSTTTSLDKDEKQGPPPPPASTDADNEPASTDADETDGREAGGRPVNEPDSKDSMDKDDKKPTKAKDDEPLSFKDIVKIASRLRLLLGKGKKDDNEPKKGSLEDKIEEAELAAKAASALEKVTSVLGGKDQKPDHDSNKAAEKEKEVPKENDEIEIASKLDQFEKAKGKKAKTQNKESLLNIAEDAELASKAASKLGDLQKAISLLGGKDKEHDHAHRKDYRMPKFCKDNGMAAGQVGKDDFHKVLNYGKELLDTIYEEINAEANTFDTILKFLEGMETIEAMKEFQERKAMSKFNSLTQKAHQNLFCHCLRLKKLIEDELEIGFSSEEFDGNYLCRSRCRPSFESESERMQAVAKDFKCIQSEVQEAKKTNEAPKDVEQAVNAFERTAVMSYQLEKLLGNFNCDRKNEAEGSKSSQDKEDSKIPEKRKMSFKTLAKLTQLAHQNQNDKAKQPLPKPAVSKDDNKRNLNLESLIKMIGASAQK